jgi:5-deoxy-D-glucuronate isomerase
MKSTLDKYGKQIENGSINPVVNVNQAKTGLVFDPANPGTPLEVIGFGVYKLSGESHKQTTGDREYVLTPIDGSFTVMTEAGSFKLERSGGPFSAPLGASTASALYIPRDSQYEISGQGELIYYTAPSSRKMKVVHVAPGEKPNLSRGDLCWRRDVITMIEPGVSTNLIVGETYSPPGLWSGTPLHVHDNANPAAGESAHEEVYYHLSRMQGREMPNYTVQLLFDGKEMNKAFLCQDRTAVAIPGGSHPVVGAPVADCLYSWGLAGEEGALGMRDIADFAYMKKIGDFVRALRSANGNLAEFSVSRVKLQEFAAASKLDEFQITVVELILKEQGIRFN